MITLLPSRFRFFLLGLCAIVCHAEAATRLNPRAAQWNSAARAGRADVLFLGDSIVAYGGGGWSNGLARAAKSSVGLSGSGLLTASYDLPFVWAESTGARIWSAPATDSVADGVQSLTPSGRYYTVPGTFSFVGTGYDPLALDMTQPIDFHAFASGLTANAQLQATRTRRIQSPWSAEVMQTSAVQPLAVAPGVSDHVFHFDANTNTGEWNSFELAGASRGAALYYTKLTQPTMKGMAVSGWSYSGGTTQGFRDLYYDHSRFTVPGRDAFYRSLVAGDSGKLNVAITFGVNDANGLISTTSYGASIQGLMADVRRDWAHAGLNASDLSFTLISAYQVNSPGFPAASYQRLSEYRAVLDAIAAGDSQVSFIDMWQAGPTSQQAVANGYLADYVHPTEAGTQVYGQTLLKQLMPTLGDADIDGDVDFDDLLALAQHYSQTQNTNWQMGDFDGVNGVAFDDLLALAQNYRHGTVVSSESFVGDWALAQSLVPEPITMPFLLVMAPMLRRRRA